MSSIWVGAWCTPQLVVVDQTITTRGVYGLNYKGKPQQSTYKWLSNEWKTKVDDDTCYDLGRGNQV